MYVSLKNDSKDLASAPNSTPEIWALLKTSPPKSGINLDMSYMGSYPLRGLKVAPCSAIRCTHPSSHSECNSSHV